MWYTRGYMTKKPYTQLSQEERDRIFIYKEEGMWNSEIADKLGRNKSTIGRELRRNVHQRLRRYLPDTAGRKADKRKELGRKEKYVAKQPKLKKKIIALLGKGWSPDLIAGRLKLLGLPYLNQESIYQFIYCLEGRKLNLRKYLRQRHRIRYAKCGRKARNNCGIPNRTDIEKRPKFIEKRIQFGHWEGDNVVYDRHKSALSTLIERRTRKAIIFRPRNLSSKEKAKGTIRRCRSFPKGARRTMTYDNGKEAAAHEAVTAAIGMKFFFAKPHSPWQRGTNENRNGLVRFYMPRKTNLQKATRGQIRKLENSINNRPMKCLDYLTPNEAFEIEMNKLRKADRKKN